MPNKYSLLVFLFCFIQMEASPINTTKSHGKEIQKIYSVIDSSVENLSKEVFYNKNSIQKIESDNSELKNVVKKLSDEIDMLNNTYINNLKRNKIGSIILLIGLLIEIIGASLLAGNSLFSKIKTIDSIKVESTLNDLAMSNVNQEPVLIFVGYVGATLLTVGFFCQFIGTALVISFSGIFTTIIIGIGFIFPVALMFYLTGQTPEQSRMNKVSIILKNIYRIIILPIIKRMIPKRYTFCDGCFRFILKNEGVVMYMHEKVDEKYRFLHTPHKFCFGHKSCILELESYKEILRRKKIDPVQMENIKIEELTAEEFIQEKYQKILDFIEEYKKYWANRRMDDTMSHKNHSEVELIRLYKKLK